MTLETISQISDDHLISVSDLAGPCRGRFLANGAAKEAAWIIGAIQARLTRFGAQFEPTDNAEFQKSISLTRETLDEEQFCILFCEGIECFMGRMF